MPEVVAGLVGGDDGPGAVPGVVGRVLGEVDLPGHAIVHAVGVDDVFKGGEVAVGVEEKSPALRLQIVGCSRGRISVDADAEMEDVWSVENGILVCKGEPGGYLYTKNDFESFRLVVEWRWPEEPGNSGVLMRITGDPEMLPNSVEAQLQSGNAGDVYSFQGFKIGGDEDRLSEIGVPGWRLAKIEANENPPGEWNRYEITADGDKITLVVNGKRVNEATRCDVRPGRIGLQSEGGVIHFRTVALTPF